MTIYQPATAHSASIKRPRCPKCHTGMMLSRIEPTDKPDHDKRTFECAVCQFSTIEVVKYK